MVAMFTLIGDVVRSRDLADRGGAQTRLGQVLADVNGLVQTEQQLEATVGDEFQGAFASVGDATMAALLVRLALRPAIDVRCGIGHGEVTVHDAVRRPLLQDGPGWWSARDALELLGRPRRAASRTWYDGPDSDRVNAFLVTRDSLVDRLGERAQRMLALALRGATQGEIAEVESISKSAVSQQFARGVGAVREAQELFGKTSST